MVNAGSALPMTPPSTQGLGGALPQQGQGVMNGTSSVPYGQFFVNPLPYPTQHMPLTCAGCYPPNAANVRQNVTTAPPQLYVNPYNQQFYAQPPGNPAATQSANPAATQSATPAATQSANPAATQSATPAATQSATPAATQPATPAATQPATPAATQPANAGATQPADASTKKAVSFFQGLVPSSMFYTNLNPEEVEAEAEATATKPPSEENKTTTPKTTEQDKTTTPATTDQGQPTASVPTGQGQQTTTTPLSAFMPVQQPVPQYAQSNAGQPNAYQPMPQYAQSNAGQPNAYQPMPQHAQSNAGQPNAYQPMPQYAQSNAGQPNAYQPMPQHAQYNAGQPNAYQPMPQHAQSNAGQPNVGLQYPTTGQGQPNVQQPAYQPMSHQSNLPPRPDPRAAIEANDKMLRAAKDHGQRLLTDLQNASSRLAAEDHMMARSLAATQQFVQSSQPQNIATRPGNTTPSAESERIVMADVERREAEQARHSS